MLTLTRLFNQKREEANPDGGEAGGGGGETSFLDQFDGDVRSSLEKNGVADLNGLAKQFIDAQSYIGNSIRVPSEEAGEADRQAFYEKIQRHAPDLIPRPDSGDQEAMNALYSSLGRPEDANGYELPEGVKAEDLGEFSQWAHGANLTKGQFNALVSKMTEHSTAEAEAAKAKHAEGLQQLKQEWGQAFDQNQRVVSNLLQQTGAPSNIVEAASRGELDANVAKWLHGLSSQFKSEGQEMTGQEGERVMTPQEATEQLDEIYANPEHPYFNQAHPSHKAATDKVLALMAYKLGQKPKK